MFESSTTDRRCVVQSDPAEPRGVPRGLRAPPPGGREGAATRGCGPREAEVEPVSRALQRPFQALGHGDPILLGTAQGFQTLSGDREEPLRAASAPWAGLAEP